MWLGIWSNGAWMSLITNETIDSEKFMLFIEYADCWLKENNYFGYTEVLIILDNSSIHKTTAIKNRFLTANYNAIYLPCYTPQWAPVELWFSIIKNQLRNNRWDRTLNLSLKKNLNIIYNSMKSLKWEIIKKLYKRLIRELKLDFSSSY